MTSSDLVVLAGGVAVPLTALRLAWALETRGCTIGLDPGGALLVGPRSLLTDADRALIRRLKPALVTLVRYCDEREAVQ